MSNVLLKHACCLRVMPEFAFELKMILNAVQLNKFDYRLANRLDTDLQKLRCRVNYHALQFANPILEMGKMLVQRMQMRSKHYIALHLRHV
ncbi:GDP-fucose protein O-fucosyltransferase [Gossypium australe]|uniref:O-fucosyltransferase family protein n=1 Tax=Gossypium australe TaxID=47621 RepID=A0A5B6WUK2_9ROSI|nr:GDP-fucose protein O-fucosyltransferase [Gossypium australe]